MARRLDKQKAIELRRLGKTYREIREVIRVSKSTLSGWLAAFPLTEKQISRSRQKRIENYIISRKRKRDAILKEIYSKERLKILPLSKRDIFIGGLFLYLGEGGKTKMSEIAFSNTDPAIIRAFISWVRVLGVDISKIYFRLHLYKDMNPEEEIDFWCNKLKVARSQFRNSYIKKSNLIGLTYKNGYGHGTCNARICDAILGKRVFMGLQVVKDYMMRP